MASAIKTGGTSTTAVLQALQWQPSTETPGGTGWITDLAAMNAYVTGQFAHNATASNIYPIPRVVNGVLYFEGRGQLKINQGDWLYVDPVTGYPFIVPQFVVTAGSFVHS